MTNTQIIFFSILIAILLAILILWCADVLAHNDGNPAAHFEPYTTEDLCWDHACKDSRCKGAQRGKFYLVGRAGDSGDEPLELGQAVILIATEPTALHLTPEVQLNDQFVRGWGAEKVSGTD